MLAKLADDLPDFGGERSRCRCFAHVLNLVVKSILQLFEGNEKQGEVGYSEESDEEDNVEGWQDECATMERDEVDGLNASVQPIKSMLVKVSKRIRLLFVTYSRWASFTSSHTPTYPSGRHPAFPFTANMFPFAVNVAHSQRGTLSTRHPHPLDHMIMCGL